MRNLAYNYKLEVYDQKWLQSSFAGLDERDQNLERKWNECNIWKNAPDVKSMFHGFEYLMEVDWTKILANTSTCFRPTTEFVKQFYYPNRALGDHSFVMSVRGEYTDDEHLFEFIEYGRCDAVYVATNNSEDGTFIALKYK